MAKLEIALGASDVNRSRTGRQAAGRHGYPPRERESEMKVRSSRSWDRAGKPTGKLTNSRQTLQSVK